MKNEYWLHDEAPKIVDQLTKIHSEWGIYSTSPFRTAWVRNILAYYSPVLHPGSWDTSLVFEGLQGELIRMYTPQARSMTRQLVTLVTKNPLSVKVMAEVMNEEIMDNLKLGNAIVNQIVEQQQLDHKKKQLTELAIVAGIGFTYTRMRTDKGSEDPILDENGAVVFDGEVDCTVHTPFDVYYDSTIPNWDDLTWVEVRTMKNKWDLIAQFPELTDEILAIPSSSMVSGVKSWFERVTSNDDMIYTFDLYVRPCASLPKGRMIMYAGPKCVFYDDYNKYGTIPIEPMIPEQVMGTTLGYPQFTNLMACQEMFDNSISAIATNQAQFAVQNIAIPRSANINVQEIGGMRYTFYTPQNVPGGGKPEPLQMTASSPETFKFADFMESQMMSMINLNGALRGAPPSGASSGVAIATLAANALEFTTSLQEAMNKCMAKTIKNAIKCYIAFTPDRKRQVQIQGTNNQMISKTYTGNSLKSVTGIEITLQNPLMQTTAGRLEVAEKLLQMPRDLWGQYVAILEGEPLSTIYADQLSEEDLIEAENEEMSKGNQVPSLITDDHAKHIQRHAGALNDPRIRLEGKANQIFLDHILNHYNLAMQQDPGLTAMIRTGKMPEGGIQPPPPSPGELGGPPPAVEPPPRMPPGTGMQRAKDAEPTKMPALPTSKPAKDLLRRG